MSSTVTVSGTSYSVPAEGDSNWASDVTALLIQLATSTKVLQNTTSSFVLAQDLSFGTNYGIKTQYLKSQGTNPSSTGVLRLANNESLSWRNAANNADYALKVNASNEFQFNGEAVLTPSSSGLNLLITNAMVSNSAAIAYSKLNLASSIVNADISGSASIQYSKLNLGTSIVNSDISGSASVALNKLAATTASRALVSDASGFVSASATTSAEIGHVSGVTSAIQTQLDAKIAKSLTTTTGDMIYASGASTPARLPVGSSGQVLKTVGGLPTWATFSGGINYLSSNPDAESDTTGWSTYADAAGTSPVDGTGGSPDSTWTRSTSSPLRGSASFLFTHNSGASRQGEGVSFDFTIDTSDKAKVLNVEFDYLISSGTFVAGSSGVDSDLTVWIYDVTNSTIIQPSSYKLLSNSSTIADKFSGTFQSASNSTSYRLIIHCGSTSTSAFVVQFDNFKVGPSEYTSNDIITARAYRSSNQSVATSAETDIVFNATSFDNVGGFNTSTGVYTVQVPGKYKVKTSLYISSAASEVFTISIYKNSTQVAIRFFTSTADAMVEVSDVLDCVAGDTIKSTIDSTADTSYTIIGSSSATFMTVELVSSSPAVDGRVVAARYTTNTAQPISNATNTIIDFEDKDFDSHGSVTTGASWKFTAGSSGVFNARATITSAGTGNFTGTEYIELKLYKNGSFYSSKIIANFTGSTAAISVSHSDEVNLVAGDYIDFRVYQVSGASLPLETTAGYNFCTVKRLSGPSAIAASESVNARYTSASTSINNSGTIVQFNTADYDSHSSVTTGASWKFTAPISGKYNVAALLAYTAQTIGVGGIQYMYLYKNGSSFGLLDWTLISSVTNQAVVNRGSTTIRLLAGDYIDIRAWNNTTTSLSGNVDTHVSIERVGNY